VIRGVLCAPLWSSDGRHVSTTCDYAEHSSDGAWIASWNQNTAEVIRANGAQRTDVQIRGHWLAWSPDSRLLAYQGVDGTDVLDPRTGRSRRLTAEHGFALAWSPDGRLLAYIQGNGFNGSFTEHGPLTGDLKTVTLTGRVRTVVAAKGAYGGPVVSFAWTRVPAGMRYRAPARPGGLYTRWRVTQLASDGDRIAYNTCAGAAVWDTAASTVTGGAHQPPDLPPDQCDDSENGDVYGLALAGGRAATTEAYGGNTHFWSVDGLDTATGQDFDLDSGGETCCLTQPTVAGQGDLLVFATHHWDGTSYTLDWQIRRVGPNGGCPCQTVSAFSEQGDKRVSLDDVDSGRIVVDRPEGLQIIDATGATLLELPVTSREAVLTGTTLIVHVDQELRVYDALTGSLLHTFERPGLPAAYPRRVDLPDSLQDAARGLAAYVLDGNVHLLRLADGADQVVAPGTLARFTDTGLAYADGARIHFVGYARLPLRASD
jgi:hypothetical protein